MMRLTAEQRARVAALERDGQITPAEVLADAAAESSPLHALFEWDDRAAAARHRLEIARQVLRAVQITVTIESQTLRVPVYVRDPNLAPAQGYSSIASLRRDPSAAEEALRGEFMRAAGALRRARLVAAALGLEESIDQLLEELLAVASRIPPAGIGGDDAAAH